MSTRLLRLSITVVQHDSGEYFWQILESADHFAEYEMLVEGVLAFATYAEALNHGTAALLALCADPAVGPVEPDEDAMDDLYPRDGSSRY